MQIKPVFYLPLLILFSLGCTKSHQGKPGFLKKAEQVRGLDQIKTQHRVVAQTKPFRCLKDRMTLNQVRRDIFQLETELNHAPPKQMDWNGLPLREFSPSQARYLSENIELFYRGNERNYRQCRSAPCIINSINQSPDSLYGEMAYWWWLRMGSSFYFNKYVNSDQRALPQPIQLSKSLFTSEEMKAFWQVSWLLPESFRQLKTLSKIMRVYHGIKLDKNSRSCGRASTPVFFSRRRTEGRILLADKCLGTSPSHLPTKSNYHRELSAFIYEAILHEIGHHVEHEGEFYTSDSEEWRDISGWRRINITDPSSGSVVKVQWDYDTKKDNFLRDYGKTNPAEDFADSVAYFRLRPIEFQEKAPGKYIYLKKNVYAERGYVPEDLKRFYSGQVERKVAEEIPRLVNQCTKEVGRGGGLYKKNIELSEVFDKEVEWQSEYKLCLYFHLDRLFDQQFLKLRQTEYEGCRALDEFEGEIKSDLVRTLPKKINQALAEKEKMAQIEQAQNELRKRLQNNIDPSSVIVSCHREENPEACYNQSLGYAFEVESDTYKEILHFFLDDMAKNYLEENSYQNAKKRTAERFNRLFSGIKKDLMDSAEKTWIQCTNENVLSQRIPDEDLNLSPFTGGAGYLRGEVIHCVNEDYQNSIIWAIKKELGKNDEALDAQTQSFLVKHFGSLYNVTLDELRAKEQTKEASQIEELKQQSVAQAAQLMVKNSDWLVNEDGAWLNCLGEAQKYIKKSLEENLFNKGHRLTFHSQSDLWMSWSEHTCQKVKVIDARYKDIFEGRRSASMNEFFRLMDLQFIEEQKMCEKKKSKYDFLKSIIKTADPVKTCMSVRVIPAILATYKSWSKTPYAKNAKGSMAKVKKEMLAAAKARFKELMEKINSGPK